MDGEEPWIRKMKKLIRIFIFVIAGLIILTCINYGYTAWSIHHWKNVLEQSSFEQLKNEHAKYYYQVEVPPAEQLLIYQQKQLLPNIFYHDLVVMKSSLSGIKIYTGSRLKSTSRGTMKEKLKLYQEDGFKEGENVSSVGEVFSSSLKLAGFKEYGH